MLGVIALALVASAPSAAADDEFRGRL